MLEDTKQVLSSAIFRGQMRYPCMMSPAWCILRPYPPDCTFTTTTKTEPQMRMAAAVCKKWREDFQKYVETQLSAFTARTHECAVKTALNLCNCDDYNDKWNIPLVSTLTYHLYLDQKQVLSVTFTRRHVAHSADATVSQF